LMLILGIESSAHTFGVGVVSGSRIIANEKSVYNVGARGMVPSKVAEFHTKNAAEVIERAVRSAGISLSDLQGIGYAMGPGLGPCLQVGQLAAKTLAAKLGVGIAPVNHAVAHAEVTRVITGFKDPITLYVSGGNSQILKLTGGPRRHYHVLGETFDIGIGNMLDAFARAAQLKPAWGSTVAKMAEGGRYVELPYTVKGMDFAFTGLLTRASELLSSSGIKDVCYSLQETAFAMLCEATERALLLSGSRELCVCGGVAQSRRLKQMLRSVCREHRMRFGFASDDLNADNGAMIAVVAERMLSRGRRARLGDCGIKQRYRIESAEVV
jgi:glycoprotease/Kae1 family metallohydrolase